MLWQPQIASVSLLEDNRIAVSGSGFRGISEGSSGNSQDSAADYPVLELMGLNGGQTFFLRVTNWSVNSLISAPLPQLPAGYLLATVFVNGIPSTGQIFANSILPPTAPSQDQIPGRILLQSIGPSGVTISYAGLPGVTYSVQRALTLAGPWTTITTVTAGESGTGRCLDSEPPVDKAFYRISYP